MKLIVGIGNPGKEYEKTRHNVGFLAIDEIAKNYDVEFDQSKFKSIYGIARINNERVVLMKPETYVNLSGSAVVSMMNYYNIDIEDVLIISDDVALPVGKIRVRFKGSAGGHNGLDNIIKYLKTNEFKRMRIGVGSNNNMDMANFVLGKFSKDDFKILDKTFDHMRNVPTDFIEYSFSDFMNKYNREI